MLFRSYRNNYNCEVPASRIAVTMGASGAFTLAFLACFEPGDRVAVPTPGYPCYRNVLEALNIDVVEVPVGPETRYQPSPELLASVGPIDGLVVASPSNPTGTMLSSEDLTDLIHWCQAEEVRFISDEIYHGITYGIEASSAASLWEEVVVVNSFSKYFSMTGWRVGWLVLPPDLVSPVERLAQNAFIAATSVSQHAALGALASRAELEENLRRYATNREILLRGLPQAGIDNLAPANARRHQEERDGLVPDALLRRPTGLDAMYKDHLHDVKIIHMGSSTYSDTMVKEKGVARCTNARANKVNGQYLTKARKLDTECFSSEIGRAHV